jgi:hypothetical protein
LDATGLQEYLQRADQLLPRHQPGGGVPGDGLMAGDKPTDLRVLVGTMSAQHRCWVVVRSHDDKGYAFPKGVYPEADVEFPPKTAGGPPVTRRYVLDQFC